MSSEDTLYLIDGSGYIFRAFYATPRLSTSDGKPTNAVFGFVRMIAKLMSDTQLKYGAVLFDAKAPTFRSEIYPDYKGNRPDCPEDLALQMEYFQPVCELLGFYCLKKPGVEADDMIATLVERYKGEFGHVQVISGDKDLTQLVTDNVLVIDPMRDRTYDRDYVKKKFGVFPEQIRDYLAIAGDSSDNIPGVPGVGPKTAVRLLDEYGDIDRLVENIEAIPTLEGLRGAKRVSKLFSENLENLEVSKKLVTLKSDIEELLNLDSSVLAMDEPQHGGLSKFFDDLEFSLTPELLQLSSGEGNEPTDEEEPAAESFKTVLVLPDGATNEGNEVIGFSEFLNKLKASNLFAFDTETTSLDTLSCELVGMSFAFDEKCAYYLPLRSVEVQVLDWSSVRDQLVTIFADDSALKVGVNLKFDISALKTSGFEVSGKIFDCYVASYVINPDRGKPFDGLLGG